MEAGNLLARGLGRAPARSYLQTLCLSKSSGFRYEPMDQSGSKYQQPTKDPRELFYKRNTQSIE